MGSWQWGLLRTTSPGTRSSVGSVSFHSPSRRHGVCSDCIFLSASSALSALLSCHTPTMALRIRIVRITAGSTNASSARPPSSDSSMKARIVDSNAAPSRIWTSWSSNCSSTSFHSGVGSSWSSSFRPYCDCRASTSAAPRPLASVTFCSLRVCGTDRWVAAFALGGMAGLRYATYRDAASRWGSIVVDRQIRKSS